MSLSLAYPRVTTVGDFLALLKPRVMSLVIFTGLAGIVAAPGHVHPLIGFTALLCIAVAAGGSGCLNMAYDSDIDRLMTRTATRPIPMGHVAREDALAFGWTLSVASVAVMGLFVRTPIAFWLATRRGPVSARFVWRAVAPPASAAAMVALAVGCLRRFEPEPTLITLATTAVIGLSTASLALLAWPEIRREVRQLLNRRAVVV